MADNADRIESLFAAATALPAAERAAYLDQACAGEANLRGRVEALLRAHDRAGHLLDRPGGAGAASTGVHAPGGEQPGTVVAGRYKLLEEIGQGGMGSVWVAEQTQPVRRKVAVKLIKPGMDSHVVLARFEAERQALAVLDHPNIAKVLDGGVTEAGRPFFVMEYVKGVPITEYCEAARLSVPERLRLFVQVCSAVQHAHQKGIIHRDLKPSNILAAPYDDKPVPKVIDFGLAKALHQPLTERTLHTAHETVLGTPLYMSPEQAQLNNLDVDTRSDIYSLGVLLYELLTGTTPLEKRRFKDAAWEEVKRLIREEEPPRPSARLSSTDTLPSLAAGRQTEPAKLTKLVRGELDWIAMKALEKDRTRRYETATGFAADVQRYLTGEPVQAAPPGVRYRLGKLARKHRTALTTAAVFALLLVVGAAVSTWQAVRATQAEQEAKGLAAREEQQRQEAERKRGEAQAAAAAEKKARKAEAAARARAQKAEGLAKDRLAEVSKEKQRADREARLARAVSDFLRQDLLRQADSRAQVESGFAAEPNLTVKEALDRAAGKIEGRFQDQPLEEAAVRQAIGEGYRGVGAAARAVSHLRRAWELRKGQLGPGHLETLTSLAALAGSYLDGGRPDRALPLYQEILKRDRKNLGADDPLTLADMNNVARAYQAAGRLDRAVPLFEKVLAVLVKQPAPDYAGALAVMSNLGLAYLDAGRVKEAVPLFEKALALSLKQPGPNHPDTLQRMNNLALAYTEARDLDRALPLSRKVLAESTRSLGPDHPETLTALNNLGCACSAAGRPEKALKLFEQALAGRRAKLGPDHTHTLQSMCNLAVAYHLGGRPERAVPLLEEALAKRKVKPGPSHPDTLTTMVNLAAAYRESGQTDRALRLFEAALEKEKGVLGPDHPVTLSTVTGMARAYLKAGQPAKALKLFQQALAGRKKTLGLGHPDTLASMSDLAGTYEQAGQLAQAEALYRGMLEQARKQFGPGHPETAGRMAQVGFNLLRQQKYADAEPVLRACLAVRAKQQPNDWLTFNTRSLLGGALLGQKKVAEAEPLLKQGYDGMKERAARIPPQAKARLTEALERLVQLYEATSRQDEAARWRKELQAARASAKGAGK
jgi:hypothetical protein